MNTKAADRTKSQNGSNRPRYRKIRIVLVDDNELFRAGIKSLVFAKKDLLIVGEAKERNQALELIKGKKPNVVLLNLEMQNTQGLLMIPELMAACKTSRLAVLTGSRDPKIHREAVESGATGIISKQDPPKLLIDAIRRVHAGGAWLDRFVAAKMFVNSPGSEKKAPNGYKISSLTPREREVILMIGKGLKNKQIAEQLYISDVTVHHHLTSIYSKLEITNRLELIIFAYRNRLADVPT